MLKNSIIKIVCSIYIQSLQDFAIRWIYRKSKQTPQFSQELANFRNCPVTSSQRAFSQRKVVSRFEKRKDSLAFSSCLIYKSYIEQMNRKRNESALLRYLLWKRRYLLSCSRSRDTVIHSTRRYSEESSRIHRGINNISVKSCEKHSNSAHNSVKATGIRTNATDVETSRIIVQ